MYLLKKVTVILVTICFVLGFNTPINGPIFKPNSHHGEY